VGKFTEFMLHNVVQHEAAVGEPKAVSLAWGEYLIGQSKTVARAAGGRAVDCLICGEGTDSIIMLASCIARLCSGLH
jgi:hypothetical protein